MRKHHIQCAGLVIPLKVIECLVMDHWHFRVLSPNPSFCWMLHAPLIWAFDTTNVYRARRTYFGAKASGNSPTDYPGTNALRHRGNNIHIRRRIKRHLFKAHIKVFAMQHTVVQTLTYHLFILIISIRCPTWTEEQTSTGLLIIINIICLDLLLVQQTLWGWHVNKWPWVPLWHRPVPHMPPQPHQPYTCTRAHMHTCTDTHTSNPQQGQEVAICFPEGPYSVYCCLHWGGQIQFILMTRKLWYTRIKRGRKREIGGGKVGRCDCPGGNKQMRRSTKTCWMQQYDTKWNAMA